MPVRVRLSVVLLVVALIAPEAFGQTKTTKYLTKDTFFQMESIQNPEIAPDGSLVVFARGFVDVMKDQNASNLWVVDTRGERLRQLTDGTWRDTAPNN